MKTITTTDEKKIITLVQKEITDVSKQQITKVKNEDDLVIAKQLLSNIKTAREGYKTRIEDEIIKPIKKSLRSLQDFWKPFTTSLDDLEKEQKGSIGVYVDDQEEKRIEKERKQADKIQKKIEEGGDAEKEIEKLQDIRETIPDVQRRVNRVVKVVDEKLIPKKYWIIDMVALRRDAVTNGLEVPGAVVEDETIIVNG